MASTKVQIDLESKSHSYKVLIGQRLLDDCGLWARKCLPESTQKIVIISNKKVFGYYGKKVQHSFQMDGFDVYVWLMKDGEEYKNLASLQESLSFFSKNNLNRTDAVVALGGGVVGDLAGFAAAVYLRGIAFLQIPTTVLAMIDSSVGGKTAVNTEYGKNLVGSFYQPRGVLVDADTLRTLEQRELVAGFCEAIKQGAIGDRNLFDRTSSFLNRYKIENYPEIFDDKGFIKDFVSLLALQVKFKAEIVIQDEQEAIGRRDVNSRKILNFGHTTAHALEKITNYKYFRHGEAVGYGILVAAEISKRLEILDTHSVNLLNDVVSSVGKLPDTNDIDIEKVYQLFNFDKKSIGDSLQWVLLEGIGKPKIISNQEIPEGIIRESLQKILHK